MRRNGTSGAITRARNDTFGAITRYRVIAPPSARNSPS